MSFKIGICLLLFGILLTNAGVDNGAYFFLAGLFAGIIGLVVAIAGASEKTKNTNNEEAIHDNGNEYREDKK